ncbi:MAG: glycosyltransferase family 4 protein [Daejeonella sp.]
MGLIVGIDGSRNRSGGARAHLIGILSDSDPRQNGIDQIHVWSYKDLLDLLPNYSWLIKHNPPELEKSIFHQILWQFKSLTKVLKETKCDILLNTDAGTVCRHTPSVVMSRDMLSYEPGAMARYGFSFARLRLLLLKYMQANSLKGANGVIFLTKYASDVIQRFTGPLPNVEVIPHGISDAFRNEKAAMNWPDPGGVIKCVYVSNFDLYKHQDNVAEAIVSLKKSGVNIALTLIGGGGSSIAENKVKSYLKREDPNRDFIEVVGHVKHSDIPVLMRDKHVFVFASSCENMPNTLIEGMCSGLPIACSNRGPMPEVLQDGGVYFNPEDVPSIVEAIQKILSDTEHRTSIAARAKGLSELYSWRRSANLTWDFLVHTHRTTFQ